MLTYYDEMVKLGDFDPFIVKLANSDFLTLERDEEGLYVKVNEESIPANETVSFDDVKNECFRMFEKYIRFQVIKEGPKVFKPTSLQCRLLEQMTLNISFEDFAQPFKTIIIEYPKDFADTHLDVCELSNEKNCRPCFSILHFHKGAFFHYIYIKRNKNEMYTRLTMVQNFKDWINVEDWINNDERNEFESAMCRIAMAYCLLLDEYGVKRVAPCNEKEYNELLHKSKKKTSSKFNNQRLLKAQPIVYEINQTPVLAKIVKSEKDLPPNETGKKMPPHRRRGHYAMIACGKGRTQRKRIRRPPVFVNKHLFLGDMSDVKVVYESKE